MFMYTAVMCFDDLLMHCIAVSLMFAEFDKVKCSPHSQWHWINWQCGLKVCCQSGQLGLGQHKWTCLQGVVHHWQPTRFQQQSSDDLVSDDPGVGQAQA